MSFKILIVDDQLIMRKHIATLLASIGYEQLEFANDGLMAWDKIIHACENKVPFELVICDLIMPKMDGAELLKKLRDFKAEPDQNDYYKTLAQTPYIAATAESDTESFISLISAGANSFIAKPYSKDDLKNKLEMVLNKEESKIEN